MSYDPLNNYGGAKATKLDNQSPLLPRQTIGNNRSSAYFTDAIYGVSDAMTGQVYGIQVTDGKFANSALTVPYICPTIADLSTTIAANFTPVDVPGASATITVPIGETCEVVFGCNYCGISVAGAERDLNLTDGSNAVIKASLLIADASSGVGTGPLHGFHSFVSTGGVYTFKLRYSGNGASSGVVDMRGLYLRATVIGTATT